MDKRTEVYGMTPDEVRSEVVRAVEHAFSERTGDLRALREAALASQGILTAEGVGKLLSVSARHVTERLVPRGLKCYRVGKAPLFLLEDVRTFLKQQDGYDEEDRKAA
jgi:hypothetical protein